MMTREITREDMRLAVEWYSQRAGMPVPPDWFPATGLAVLAAQKVLCVTVLYLDKTSPVAVLGWCITNPENTGRESCNAVRMVFQAMPDYARSMGVKHLISIFGSRSLNRLLDRLGFIAGDLHVEEKYKLL